MDRNLAVGFTAALLLAALLELAIRQLPVHLFQPPVPSVEPKPLAAWAEPRDIDWRPKPAPAAPPAPTSVPPAAAANPAPPAKPRAAAAPATPGAAFGTAPQGAVELVAGTAPGTAVAAAAEPDGGAPAAGGAGSGVAADHVYGAGDVDVPPAPLATPQPAFPRAAEQLGLSAEVVVVLVVDADGRVLSADARCSGCDASFLRAARDAARTWRFAPARLHGEPVRVRVEQRIHFDLDE